MIVNAYLRDLAERVLASFAGGVAAWLIADTTLDLTDPKVWIAGAAAGGVAAVKGLAAYYAADKGTASLVSTKTPRHG